MGKRFVVAAALFMWGSVVAPAFASVSHKPALIRKMMRAHILPKRPKPAGKKAIKGARESAGPDWRRNGYVSRLFIHLRDNGIPPLRDFPIIPIPYDGDRVIGSPLSVITPEMRPTDETIPAGLVVKYSVIVGEDINRRILGRIENTSDRAFRAIVVEINLYDEAKTLRDNVTATIKDLGPGLGWDFVIPFGALPTTAFVSTFRIVRITATR